jgi:hypothetical protein
MLRLHSHSSRSYPGRPVRRGVVFYDSALSGNIQGDRAPKFDTLFPKCTVKLIGYNKLSSRFRTTTIPHSRSAGAEHPEI